MWRLTAHGKLGWVRVAVPDRGEMCSGHTTDVEERQSQTMRKEAPMSLLKPAPNHWVETAAADRASHPDVSRQLETLLKL